MKQTESYLYRRRKESNIGRSQRGVLETIAAIVTNMRTIPAADSCWINSSILCSIYKSPP